MDVTGKHLADAILRYWLRALMEEGCDYETPELVKMVTDAHLKAGGLPPTLPNELLTQRFEAALWSLQDEGWVTHSPYVEGEGMDGEVVEIEESWASVFGPPEEDEDLPTLPEKKALKEGEAEVIIGEGPECVYGWYLPAYRELATLKGESRFPLKVGTTIDKPFKRMRSHIGTAPEKPVLGFVWKIKHAYLLEKWMHVELAQRKQHLPDALGDEWFLTTPEELREIVQEMAAKMTKKEDTEESLSDGNLPDSTVPDLSHRRRRKRVV